jgi:hypothetical protein
MLLPGFAWNVWLVYLSATIILVIGVGTLTKDFGHRRGLDKLVALGPLFIAIPIAIFGTEHFTAATILAGMVPGWIPGHMFWALFVGTCRGIEHSDPEIRVDCGCAARFHDLLVCASHPYSQHCRRAP